MNRRILVVVATNADRQSIVTLITMLVFPDSITRTHMSNVCEVDLLNGDRYTVLSVEQFSAVFTRGMWFDAVLYLVHPVPHFVAVALRACQAAHKETS